MILRQVMEGEVQPAQRANSHVPAESMGNGRGMVHRLNQRQLPLLSQYLEGEICGI